MPIQGDFFLARCIMSSGVGSRIENDYHFALTGGGGNVATDLDLGGVINTWLTEVYSTLDALLTTGISDVTLDIKEVQWTGVQWDIFRNVNVWTIDITPADAVDELPLGVAALVKFPTIYGRRMGKKFLGGFSKTGITANGAWVGAYVSGIGASLDTLLTPRTVTATPSNLTLNYAVLNHQLGGWNAPTSMLVSFEPAYQRRRKPGVGI